MKKSMAPLAALTALLLSFSLTACRGVERAELPGETAPVPGTVSSQPAPAQPDVSSLPEASLPALPDPEPQESSAPAQEPAGAASQPVSSAPEEPEESPASFAPEAPAASAPASQPEPVQEYPPADEPPASQSDSLSSIEEKVIELNVEAKAAQTAEPEPVQTPAQPVSNSYYTANNPQEMRAVWLSFLEFQTFSGVSRTAFTQRIESIYDDLLAKGMNTVIVQVRPHGDSFYDSDYYPWSKSVSGTMGTPLSYDPVDILVEEAHVRGLSVHAWVNPYRTMTEQEFATVPSYYPTRQWHDSPNRGEYMVYNSSDSRWWLQPGNQEVQELIVNGVREILNRYDVDGIHLDDYFYCAAPSAYGDTAAQAKANTSLLVKKIYQAVKAHNDTILFGVSPSGAFRMDSSLPESDRNYLSTDLALWCSKPGYIDYVMPQIYWEHDHSTQPFTETLEKWENLVTDPSVRLYVGLAPYKLTAEEISWQIDEIEASPRVDGYALFRYAFITHLSLPR